MSTMNVAINNIRRPALPPALRLLRSGVPALRASVLRDPASLEYQPDLSQYWAFEASVLTQPRRPWRARSSLPAAHSLPAVLPTVPATP